MSDHTSLPEYSDEQVAQIERNMAKGTAFLRDVLHRPQIVDEIPNGSTLAFHDVALALGQPAVRLTAFRLRRSKRWGVRVTGVGPAGVQDLWGYRFMAALQPVVETATWGSSAEAFAAVEGALQRANELHLLAG